jgi:hypothetical protein
MSGAKVNVIALMHEGSEPGAPLKVIEFSAADIVEILLSFGAPPSVAPQVANAIIEYMIKVHRDAGASRLQ